MNQTLSREIYCMDYRKTFALDLTTADGYYYSLIGTHTVEQRNVPYKLGLFLFFSVRFFICHLFFYSRTLSLSPVYTQRRNTLLRKQKYGLGDVFSAFNFSVSKIDLFHHLFFSADTFRILNEEDRVGGPCCRVTVGRRACTWTSAFDWIYIAQWVQFIKVIDYSLINRLELPTAPLRNFEDNVK